MRSPSPSPSAPLLEGEPPPSPRRRWPSLWDVAAWLLLAAVSYVPSFLTQPGKVAADTKQYLYLDPGRLIQSALSMWDPDVGAGTVTHQNIGYLFPMGPYYWLVEQLHIPVWVGQRFWMGSLFFAAGTGVYFLGRLLGLSRAGRLAAALAYLLSPFVIVNIARTSAILMPWAALGWILAFTVLAARRGGWRYPALLAIVVALVGGVNATSILLVGIAPVVWVLYAVLVTREVTARAALAAVGRIAALCLLISLWWIAGLWAEGAYGINVLKYTETLPTVSSTSAASEAIRGLGYWYFYGDDKLQPWTLAGVDYTQWPWLLGVSFAVPVAAVALSALARWRYRAFAVALVVVGVVVAVGAYPFTHPSPLGAALKAGGSDSTAGLALRSTNRVLPLVILGLALLLGSGVTALAGVRWWLGLGVLGLASALVAADLPPLWNGTLVASNLDRPSALPGYVTDAANYLDAQNHDTRVLQVPGQDFAYYRWGVTADPVWPGLMTRPYLERAAVPVGEAGSVNLLQALDESIQDGVFVPSTIAPIASLLSSGDVLFESDQQYERFNTARPQTLWLQLTSTASGLDAPISFGTPTTYTPITYPLNDETQLAVPTGASAPPPVAVFPVPDARPIERAETTERPLLVAGDGVGLVNVAATGLLANNPTILYSATFAKQPARFRQQLANGAVLVLTDTNQKQHDTWGTVDDNYGYVEQAGETLLVPEPSEATLPVFPGAPSSTQTVAQLVSTDIASARATSYGNPITNTAENQPLAAVDGNLDTAWTEGAFGDATDATLRIALKQPVTADHVTLVQPQKGPQNRWINKVTLTFDGKHPITVDLGPGSRKAAGQVVDFPARRFSTLEVTVDGTTAGVLKNYAGESSVGFAEVSIPGVAPAHEVLRLPTDLLGQSGTASADHELLVQLNRLRATVVPTRTDPETSIQRTFSLPTARSFSVGGTARISTLDSDYLVNQLLGRIPFTGSPPLASTAALAATGQAVVVASNSSSRLPGDLNATAYSAMDADPTTSWMPGFGPQAGDWLEYTLNRPLTFDHLNLAVVADGRHSVPTRITVTANNGAGTPSTSRTVDLPATSLGTGRTQGATTDLPVSFPALTGNNVRVTVDAVHAHRELDYISGKQNTSPVGIAEVGLPGAVEAPTPATVPVRCLSNLVFANGQPVDVQISGSTATALANGGLDLTLCGSSAAGVTMAHGAQAVQTATNAVTGFNVDALTLASGTNDAPLPLTATGQVPPTPVAAGPEGHRGPPEPQPGHGVGRGPRRPLLAGARTEPEPGLEGDDGERGESRHVHLDRRLCQRVGGAGRPGRHGAADHHDVDPATGHRRGRAGLGGDPGRERRPGGRPAGSGRRVVGRPTVRATSAAAERRPPSGPGRQPWRRRPPSPSTPARRPPRPTPRWPTPPTT